MRAPFIMLVAAGLCVAQGPAVKTGPEVGRKIPAFSAQDQQGKAQTLASLRGPRGLVLLFVRSADW